MFSMSHFLLSLLHMMDTISFKSVPTWFYELFYRLIIESLAGTVDTSHLSIRVLLIFLVPLSQIQCYRWYQDSRLFRQHLSGEMFRVKAKYLLPLLIMSTEVQMFSILNVSFTFCWVSCIWRTQSAWVCADSILWTFSSPRYWQPSRHSWRRWDSGTWRG